MNEVLPCSTSLFARGGVHYTLAVRRESANTLFITCGNRLLALVKLPYYLREGES